MHACIMDAAVLGRATLYSSSSVVGSILGSKPQPCYFCFPTPPSSLLILHLRKTLRQQCLLTTSLGSSVRGLALPLLGSVPRINEDESQDSYEDEEGAIDSNADSDRGNGKSLRPSASFKFHPLGHKERKQLRAYAHQLGKDLVVQSVGKWGVTPTVITSLSDALEANELIKVKVLDNCPDELDGIIQKLAESTESQIVGKVGRTVLLYRPSLTKLAAAEKKGQKQSMKQRGRPYMSAQRRRDKF
ncbi:hypothetical protein O6H91_02G081200 [Diphasiastrum complanatum]|uniref:Uncharacterized protein n=1 Tax=Diphasiastrum complanatum TaxID=34168 RepID=A0ACC2EHG5_DIPCM|nr:hypothetical protein O6H91_02G081200 [Diphasiastrum complanatum]